MRHDLYIYYRVETINSLQLNQAVKTMQAELSFDYQITTSIKQCFKAEDNQYTWMEIYYLVALDFAEIVERKAVDHRIIHLISGTRHIEFFMDP